MAILKLNGVEVAAPDIGGFNITKNKIWSSNTGRVQSGKAVGTIIAIKTTIDITWSYLTESQVEQIDNAVSDATKPFISVEYWGLGNKHTSMTAYFGDISYSTEAVINGEKVYSGVSVSAIEQ